MTHIHTSPDPAGRGRRRFSPTAAALGLGIAMLATGCSGGSSGDGGSAAAAPKKGGTLNVALSSVPPTIDPYATSLQAAWTTARNVCEPLFDVSTEFEVKPVLVQSYQYDGKLTYTLKLRQGVSFQDGEPFTANDVIASLNRYFLTPGNGSILKGLTASMTSSAPDEVTITLKKPSAVVPTLLTTAYMMPASIVKDKPITSPVNSLVCTGPYKLASYTPDQSIVLERWDGYKSPDGPADGGTGKKNAFADKIVFTPMPEASTRLQAVQTGQVDIAGGFPLDNYDAVSSSGSAQAMLTSAQSGSTVVFNKISGVMSNVKMRQAFLAALNMTDIMTAGFGDSKFFTVDGSIIPKANTVWASDAGTETFNHPDLGKVKQLLDEAGYKGQPIVWVTTKDDNTWYAPVLPAQEQLKKAGFNIQVQVVDQATLISRRNDPTKYDLFSSGIPTYADPVLLPYLQDTFPGGWTNPAKNDLLAKLSTDSDQKARKADWDQLQQQVWTDVPFLKFGTTKVLLAASNRVHVDRPDELAALYYNVSINQ
ncbi:MAG TPA: ABC transporter substrate-binding protein [Sinomonas sp.]|nr:ABC transporter substrate-binding protein [Sinomonas sp.]